MTNILTNHQIDEIRALWQQGMTAPELSKKFGVNAGYIYYRCTGLPRYKPRTLPADLNIMQMRTRAPHVLLTMFCRGMLDERQIFLLTVNSRSLENELALAAEGRTLEQVVRIYPFLLLKTMLRLETFSPKHRPGGMSGMGRSFKTQTWPDHLKEAAAKDPDLFNSESDLMREIGDIAFGIACED